MRRFLRPTLRRPEPRRRLPMKTSSGCARASWVSENVEDGHCTTTRPGDKPAAARSAFQLEVDVVLAFLDDRLEVRRADGADAAGDVRGRLLDAGGGLLGTELLPLDQGQDQDLVIADGHRL